MRTSLVPKLGALALGLVLGLASAVAQPSPSGAAAAAPVGVVNVNTASADQLTALPGIGVSKAQAIVAAREERGRFRSLDELTEVKGIGVRALERIRPFLTLSGRTTLTSP